MKRCFQLCMNNAQISYKTLGQNDKSQIENTNTVGTMVYNISLSVFYDFSNWHCRRCAWKRNNCIVICNVNSIKLYNIRIKVCFDCTHSKFYRFINCNKSCRYQMQDKNLIIKIPRLSSGEIFYCNFKNIGYPTKYIRERVKIMVYAQVINEDNKIMNICKCYNYNY